MKDIKITVLMPCFNAANYIAQAIQSLLEQRFPYFELLIVNDGSTDDTVSIIQSFTDQRIVLLEQAHQGVAAALNYGLEHARAAYIARADADDIYFPNRLEEQYQFMLDHPECIVVGSAAYYVDHSGHYIFTHTPVAKTSQEIQELSYHICPFIHSSVLYKKEPVAAIGYPVHAHSFEDHLLWQQLKGKGTMHNLPYPLLSVRLNPGSFTMDESKRARAFHRIKNQVLLSRQASKEQGEQLLSLIRQQNNGTVQQGAYHSLLAKKFLWNNYNPLQARQNIKRAIALNDFDIRDYLLWLISYLPKKMIAQLYSIFAFSR